MLALHLRTVDVRTRLRAGAHGAQEASGPRRHRIIAARGMLNLCNTRECMLS